ncbi:GntP family permease [Salsuginibacillus kocurii]|uniref:GntP family permease n=1 Tax=Salsuginibacillus kocurii TaxID=427078 RepID=UPI00036DB541|nr:GntP family permease [Salsuginibacillus kocurii]
MLSFIGLFASLALLIILVMRGINIIIAALLSSILLAFTGEIHLNTALSVYYMEGFTGYFAEWFLIFLLGAIFGKVMQDTNSAESIAETVRRTMGPQWAVFAVVGACAIMTYGGVSLFVVGFTVYPIAVSLFRIANYPHRFIPAALVFGSISFTMTSPGSPEIQNLIPAEHFQTTPTAGGFVGVFTGLFIMTVGGLWLRHLVRKAVAQGETFEVPPSSPFYTQEKSVEIAAAADGYADKKLPKPIFAILPLVIVIGVLNVLSFYMPTKTAALVALVMGIVATWVFNLKFVTEYWNSLAAGAQNSLVAIANTCAVVGFGSVAAQVSSFQTFIDVLVNLDGPPLLGLAIAVTVICGLTGSASGGLGIALPILAPIYLAKGLDPGAMHRISALASGGLDSLPHNGYVVTTVRAICGETHRNAYKPIFLVSVIVPMVAMLIAVILYSLL